MTQEFVTLPREVVEHVLKAMGCGGLLKQRQAMAALHAALEQQVEQEPVAEHELKDVRCECCGYMTHHREHMGCIRAAQPKREPLTDEQVPSPTAGMNIAQRILHVGGRNNAAGYVEFGGIQAVEALVLQVLRDLPQHREPMTDAEIADLLIDLPVLGTGYFLRIARAVEAAHNIK